MAASPPPPRHGASSQPAANIFSRATTSTRAHYVTRRPWTELLAPSSLTRPYTLGEATLRLKKNLCHFRVNYTMIALFVLFLSLLWSPISIIAFLIVSIGWFFLYFFRDRPVELLSRTVDDRAVLGVLGAVTVVVLCLTGVWLNVLVSVLIGAVVVVGHAVFRGVDDLYGEIDGGEGGGLLSVVGSQIERNGYNGFDRFRSGE